MLSEVARANASDECPDGNEGLPPDEAFSIKGQVTKGLGRFIMYFAILVRITAAAIDEAMYNEFLSVRESWLKSPMPHITKGVPKETGAAEPVTILNVQSRDLLRSRLIFFNRSISAFWE
jgi:hypothetical protein